MNNTAFTIATAKFEGPLELLFSLIEERKLSINEISIAQVTDAYLAYLEHLQEHPVAETAQFVYVAATLLLIKSRSLLPDMEMTEEEQHDIAELEARLRQYRAMKASARVLGKLWNRAPLLPPRYRPAKQQGFAPQGVSLISLKEALERTVKTLPTVAFRATVHVAQTLSLEDAVEKLQSRIRSATKLLFSEIRKGGNKAEVIVHFLALLELMKSGLVAAEQSGTFDDIVVNTDNISTPVYE